MKEIGILILAGAPKTVNDRVNTAIKYIEDNLIERTIINCYFSLEGV